MKSDFILEAKGLPYLFTKDKIVKDVGNEFLSITGYNIYDVINKSVSEVFSKTLRVNCSVYDLENSHEIKDIFLFTKDFEPIEANISVFNDVYLDEKIYVFRKKQNADFEDKLTFIRRFIEEEKVGVAIYSVPSFILLKANNKYLNYISDTVNKGKRGNSEVDTIKKNKEQYLGKCVSDLVANWDVSTAKTKWESIVCRNEVLYITERKGLLGELDERYWDNTLMPVVDNGTVKYILSMLEDVTERVNNKKKLEEDYKTIEKQAQQLKMITENMNDALFIINKDGSYDYFNKHAEHMMIQSENIKRIGDSLNHSKYYDDVGKELTIDDMPSSRVLKGESIQNVVIKSERPNFEAYFNFNGNPIYNGEGELVSALLCFRDITEKYKYEQEIRERKELLEVIIENMSESLTVVDKDGKFILRNRKFKECMTKIYGEFYMPNYVGDSIRLGQKYFDEYNNEISLQDLPSVRVIHGEKIERQKIIIEDEDKRIHVEMSATPICDDKGNLLFGVISCCDVTDRVEYYKLKEEHQKLILDFEIKKNKELENIIKLKDEFFSMVSHDFKTPLTVINSAVQAIELFCKNEMSPTLQRFIIKIKQNSFRQLRLVNNLLDISRLDAGVIKVDKKNIDIVLRTKSIVESVQLYADQKGVNLFFASSLEEKRVGLDEEKYERILLNLLSNAIKFTPKGKFITVSLLLKRGKICVQVKDEGVGIPADKQKLIFERFGQVGNAHTRQGEGTGIGLSLVKLLVEALGGSISVKSRTGKGSTFSILLPANRVKENQTENSLQETPSTRIIQATTIEFSDIYST